MGAGLVSYKSSKAHKIGTRQTEKVGVVWQEIQILKRITYFKNKYVGNFYKSKLSQSESPVWVIKSFV